MAGGRRQPNPESTGPDCQSLDPFLDGKRMPFSTSNAPESIFLQQHSSRLLLGLKNEVLSLNFAAQVSIRSAEESGTSQEGKSDS